MANLTSTKIFGDLTVKRNIKANSIMRLDGTSVVYEDRMITAGSGLTGGGNLGGNITISHTDTSSQANSTNSGRTYIQSIELDTYGHITKISTGAETVVNTNTTYSVGNGLTSSGTVFSLGTPTALSASTTDDVSSTGHTHSITGFSLDSHTHSSYDRTSSVLSGKKVISNLIISKGAITGFATRDLSLSDLGYTGATNANYFTYSHPSDGGGSIATDLTGATVISKIVVNAAGHITGTNTRSLTLANLGAQATITGGATTITSSDLATNKALVSNSSGKVDVSSVTATELGYLSGVTSKLQTQLTALVDASSGTVMYTNNVEVSIASNTINILAGSPGFMFNSATDTLMVFENLIYLLREGTDYTISGSTIVTTGANFKAGEYNFVVFKNITYEKLSAQSAIDNHAADTYAHGATSSPTPSTIVMRDASGGINLKHLVIDGTAEIFSDLTVNRNIKANSIMRLDGTSVVYEDRMITAGSGLTGGGNLGGNITISHPSDGGGSIATDLSGATVVSKIVVNAAGHVTGTNTRNITLANLGYTGSATANDYSHPTGDGNLHVPATSTTNSGKVLTAGATAGALTWNTLPTIGNATLTVKASTGISLSATPTFTANATANKTITITNSAPNVTTNITTTHNATTVTVNSSDGTNGTINAATTSLAGVVTNATQTFGGDKIFNNSLTANKVNGLTITSVSDKTLDLSNASLTVGSAGKTGTITVTSDSTSNKKITVKGDTTLVAGTMVERGFISSYQHAVTLASPSTSIAVPTGFDIDNDTLIVFENLLYFLRPTIDYTLNVNGTTLSRASGYNQANFPAGVYIFLILKNIPMGTT